VLRQISGGNHVQAVVTLIPGPAGANTSEIERALVSLDRLPEGLKARVAAGNQFSNRYHTHW
jgi:hypothetical protein